MAFVSGTINEITGFPISATRDAVIRFTLNQPNISTTGRVLPDMWAEATPDPSTGEFEITLQPTTNLFADAWYDVTVHFQQSPSATNGAGMAMISYLGLKIRVPIDGGTISDLIDVGAGNGGGTPGPNNRIVWVSQDEPPQAMQRPWMLWLEQEPGPIPDPFDPRNTSILKELRP